MINEEAPPDGYDEPSADPRIQKNYEAALGEFLVTFNRIENAVSDVIVLALEKAERNDILGSMSGDTFAQKVLSLHKKF